ncbi:conjugal transfer protein TraF [Helicobacter sp. MIT 14-3879]|uniref:conjugal transfer protein TraF n=1 Tax=Helicobacter sp. MIT 14-3879 TaxID=2040649 RepID=UPI000E1E35D4|nr:conjugal transfer protein TraF [Helicobacter sp. MIT 14-3879]RDU63519.1 hypothetical protein CQA44_05395 [Helicobacter sp. MIT 14-3879]
MKKTSFIASALFINLLYALEFGYMGNIPASVGGAGVAYRKNSWAMYYNPALLGLNRKNNIAYSFNTGYIDDNIINLTSMDIDALKDLPNVVSNVFKGNNIVNNINISTRRASTFNVSNWNFSNFGVFGDVLGNLTGVMNGNDSDLANYICNDFGLTCNNVGNPTLNDALDVLKKSDDKINILGKIKKDLQNAINTTQQNNPNNIGLEILGNIVDNVNTNNIENFLDNIKNGDTNINTILKDMNIRISKGVSPAIDAIFTIANTINKNKLTINSSNGFVYHISGSKNRGAIGMGIMMNMHSIAGINLDNTHNKIIIDGNSNYFKVYTDKGQIILSTLDKTSGENEFNNSSIMSKNANHILYANAIILSEIPISYGHTIPLAAGDLNIGGSIKYINALSFNNNQKIDFNNIDINFDFNKNMKQTHIFGIDLGALYTIDWFSLGIVGKNLNAPTIKTSIGKYKINPQFRAGISAEVWKFTFLADIDLYPNDTLEFGSKNQMVGGGVIFDANFINLRFGAMKNIRNNPYGTIFTAGVNIFHFIDISVQSSLKMVNFANKIKLPNYFDVRIGGNFQW